MWEMLLAAINRLTGQDTRIYAMELRMTELEQKLRAARGT